MAPVATAIQAMRKVALINAATIVAEVGDFSRIAIRRNDQPAVPGARARLCQIVDAAAVGQKTEAVLCGGHPGPCVKPCIACLSSA
jgi:hypothetical protein